MLQSRDVSAATCAQRPVLTRKWLLLPQLKHAEHQTASKVSDSHQQKPRHSTRTRKHEPQLAKQSMPEPASEQREPAGKPLISGAPQAAAGPDGEFDPSRASIQSQPKQPATLQSTNADPDRAEVHPAASQANKRGHPSPAAAQASPQGSASAEQATTKGYASLAVAGKCPKGLYPVDDVCVACEDYRQPSDCKSCKPPEQCRKFQGSKRCMPHCGHSSSAYRMGQYSLC